MKKTGLFVSVLTFTACLVTPVFAQEAPKFLYGVASWYGEGFEGKPTASGEIFSAEGLTAAHKTLPFGTRIEVENLGNGKKVEVLINDRGPFAENQIIDLSRRAAEILDFLNEGKTFVKVTILEMGDPTTKPAVAAIPAPDIGQDVPQGFTPSAPSSSPEPNVNPVAPPPAVTAPELDEEIFMSDTPPAETAQAPLRTQDLGTSDIFGIPAAAPVGMSNFSSNSASPPLVQDPLNPQNDPDLTQYSNIAYPNDVSNVEPENLYEPDPFADLADPFNTDSVNPTNNIWYNDITPTAGQINSSDISQNIGANQPFPTQPQEIAPPPAAPMPNPMPPYRPAAPSPIVPASPLAPVTTTPIPDPIIIPDTVAVPANPLGPVPTTPTPPIMPEAAVPQPMPFSPAPTVESIPNANDRYFNSGSAAWVPNPPNPEQAKTYYIVQAGAFSNSDNAMKIYNVLKAQSDPALANVYTADVKTPVRGKTQNVIRIRVGFFTSQEEALKKSEELDTLLGKHGIKSSVIKVDYK